MKLPSPTTSARCWGSTSSWPELLLPLRADQAAEEASKQAAYEAGGEEGRLKKPAAKMTSLTGLTAAMDEASFESMVTHGTRKSPALDNVT
jgi:hypothetical protein